MQKPTGKDWLLLMIGALFFGGVFSVLPGWSDSKKSFSWHEIGERAVAAFGFILVIFFITAVIYHFSKKND